MNVLSFYLTGLIHGTTKYDCERDKLNNMYTYAYYPIK